MTSELIDKNKYIKSLDIPNKDNYDWTVDGVKRMNNENIIILFSGVNKNDNSDFINGRAVNLKIYNDDTYLRMIKILSFIISLKNQIYFANSSVLLSKNQEFLFVYNKGNNIPLSYLIFSNKTNYLENKDLIKWIVYQITYGLYILHSNNIIHHDVKTSNILIDEEGNIFINGFESAIFKGEKSISFTLAYSSPELLINLEADEKIDLWDLGILMLELFCKKHKILENEEINNRDKSIRYILSFFGCNEKYSNQELKDMLKENKNIEFKLNKEIEEKIWDKDALDFIKNLLVFNPNKRYSAKKALESNYLKEFKDIDSLNIKPLKYPIEYKTISKSTIDKNRFIELVNTMIKNKNI